VSDFAELKDKLSYLTQEKLDKVKKAYRVAEKAHAGQKRFTGEDYITHPVAVAAILAGLQMDAQTIEAALLHDVIEDTPVDKSDIIEQFGHKVADLVDGVSKLKLIDFESRAHAQAENFCKMMLAMSADIRVILIKLADRLHNMRTLSALPAEKKQRIAKETLEIYVPIAHRLGLNQMRIEFEDLTFSALYPLRSRVLREAISRERQSRKPYLDALSQEFKQTLEESGFPEVNIYARENHVFGVYRKMQESRLSLKDAIDTNSLRIVVQTKEECYLALGIVHGLYRPLARRFKDYIAIPKANGYQSLHTYLIGPHGFPVEVLIRTKEMDNIADKGIAVHWLYKSQENDVEPIHAQEWVKGLLEIQQQTGSSLEFIENVKTDLYAEDVFIFTPKGDILSLPHNATPVDVAFAVHTDIGNKCIGCKIDRRQAPLNTRLKSGQTVEIIIAQDAHPNPLWLSFVATSKAKSSVRHWLKNQKRQESRQLGHQLLNTILTPQGISVKQLDKSVLKPILEDFHLTSMEDLFEEIALGRRIAPLVAQRILTQLQAEPESEASNASLKIKGTEGLVLTFAKCCYPIPHDHIVGALVADQGIVIHREHCSKLQKLANPQDIINVEWEAQMQGEFQVPVHIDVINNRGVLAAIASAIAESNANIVNVHIDERDERHNNIYFFFSVR
jgi:guanosine-3',5'-bis(diphosphate) 3'-pyrophosphohydrolase